MKAAKTLTDDHRELDELLTRTFAAIDSQDAKSLHRLIDLFWARLAVHIRAEHRHLFPRLTDAISGTSKNDGETLDEMIDGLRRDHDLFMKELATLVFHTGEGMNLDLEKIRHSLGELKIRLSSHNRTEETKVYQMIELILSPDDAADLREKIQQELQNLPPRFADAKSR
jgi:hypothetical protein